jgi:cytochrome c oxidase subunit I+III
MDERVQDPLAAPGEPDPQDDPALRRAQAQRLRRVWAAPKGLRYWTAVNNTEVGLWYTATAFIFFLLAGILALLIRAQLAVPNNDLIPADVYNQIFTMHGTVMMFLFAVPIFEAFSIFLLPQLLGARELPFPRLTAYGYWCYVFGGTFVFGSLFFGAAPDGGWFMYPPLVMNEETSGIGTDIWLLGLGFIEIAAIAAAVELIVGVLKNRAPGMRLNLMPTYAWYVLVVGIMILFGFPPLMAGDLLMELQSAFDFPFFDPARGGDPVLWQHLFWIFGHPEVYVIFLPAIALLSMIVPTFAQRPIVGYTWIVLAAVTTGFLSFGLWVHHMYTTGLPGVSLAFFSAASVAVAIPTAIQIFVFLATLLLGRVILSIPMLFGAGALAIFVIGGLTGVMVALAPFDWQAHDSYFVVAHLHYVLIGGVVFPIVAGLYYYYPMAVARTLTVTAGRIAFVLMFVGFNVAFLPMHITGLRGMPRRVYTYPEGLGFDWLNLISTVGAFVFAAGVAVIVVDAIRVRFQPIRARRNPWSAGTLEWIGEMPNENWGVRSIPMVTTRYPLWQQPNLMREMDEGRFFLPDAKEGLREGLVTTVVDAKPLHVIRIPGPSGLPVLAAFFTAAAFIAATFKFWWFGGATAVLTTATILVWLWQGTGRLPEADEKDAGRGLRLPLYASGPISVSWWGMLITLLADATAFVSLVFAYFFYATVHPYWPPVDAPVVGAGPAVLVMALAAGSWLALRLGRRALHAGSDLLFIALAAGAVALGLAAFGASLLWLADEGLVPSRHAYDATVWTVVVFATAHYGLGALMAGYCMARNVAGKLTARYPGDLENVMLFFTFATLMTFVAAGVAGFYPLVAQ